MPAFRVHWGGSTVIEGADNEDHAKQMFHTLRPLHVRNDIEVYDVEALPSDNEPGLRETFIRLGQHR